MCRLGYPAVENGGLFSPVPFGHWSFRVPVGLRDRAHVQRFASRSSFPDAINVVTMAAPLESVNSQTFKDQLHTNFQVQAGDSAPVTLELIKVDEPPTVPNLELFSLHFRGPASPVLSQQIWEFRHPKLGSLELFMTAIASEPAGTTYEVIFNRVRKKP